MSIRIEYDVFAKFACNSCGVRVATRKTAKGADSFAARFGALNNVETWTTVKVRSKP